MTGYLHTFLSSVFLSYLLTEMTKVTSIWRLFLQLIFQQKIYQYFVFYSADSIPNRRVTSHFNFHFYCLKKFKLSIMFFKWIFMAWKISKTQDFYSSETLISWKIFRIAGIIFYAFILFVSLMSHLAFPMTNPRFNAYAFLERLTTKIETFRVFLTLSTDSFMNNPGSSLINSQMFWISIIFPDFLWKFGLNLAWQTTTVCGLIKFFICSHQRWNMKTFL